MTVELWDELYCDHAITDRARTLARSPIHAVMLVGREGYGTIEAARAVAAELVTEGLEPEDAKRAVELIRHDRHPSVQMVRRVGARISAEQARHIVAEAALSPPEGAVQVFVLTEFHTATDAAPILLKTLEEPVESTRFVVLADSITPELVTVASRCAVLEFPPLSQAAITEALLSQGVSADEAKTVALAAGGDLHRALLLVADEGVSARLAWWEGLTDQCSMTGSVIRQLAQQGTALVDEVLAPLAKRQEIERHELLAQRDAGLATGGALKDLEAQHKREVRRTRTDELHAGLSACYRGARGRLAPQQLAAVGVAMAEFTDSLVYNVNETLALECLLIKIARAVETNST